MTNGEKYKKAFSVLQTSKGSLQEVENMAKLQRRTKMKTAAAVIAGCIILGGTGTAYAAECWRHPAYCSDPGSMEIRRRRP